MGETSAVSSGRNGYSTSVVAPCVAGTWIDPLYLKDSGVQ